MPKLGSVNIIKRLSQMGIMPLKYVHGEWQGKFLWQPTNINTKSKFVWLKTVYKRWIQIEYNNGNVYTGFEYAESLLDIIRDC